MSSFNKTNPTHGGHTRAERNDRKAENSGPVANDSLAADSLRSGGSFSRGNPTGISDVKSSQGTFSGHTQHNDAGDVHRGKKPERMDVDGEESRSHHLHNRESGRSEAKQTTGSRDNLTHGKGTNTAGPYSRPSAGSHGPEYTAEVSTDDNSDIGSQRDPGRVATRQAASKTAAAPQSAQVDSNRLTGDNPFAALSSE